MINSKKTFVWVFAFLLAFAACEKDDPKSDEAFITGFTLAGVTATVSGSSITLSVPYGTDISNLSPTISNSLASTITPAAGTARDFGSPVTYTVTAEDGKTSNSYTVTVTVLDPDSVAIASFSIPDVDSQIDESAKTITVNVFEGTDVSALTPSITTIPADATLNLGGGTSLDLNSSVTITVSAGSKSESYTVSVNFLSTGFDAENPVILLNAGVLNVLPPELGDAGDNERGFSLSSSHVYVADKGEGVIHYWNNDGTSAAASQLKNGDIVSGGVWKLADVVATENGILGSNMNWAGGDFKVYRWKDHEADPELFLSYPTKDSGNNIRLGDNINFVDDPQGDGYLTAMVFTGFNSIPNNTFVLIWDVVNGSITNAENPRKIEFAELNNAGNYGYVEAVEDANDEYLLVNGANIVPTLYDLDGTQKLTSIGTDAIKTRTFGGKIFEFNQKRYLALVDAGPENDSQIADRPAALLIYDITGGSLVEAFNAIKADNVESKLVVISPFGNKKNGNQSSDVDVFVDPSGERVVVMAGAANNGFQVIELKKAQ
ncbi:MAG: DUF5018 domain-containing protein [Flavobacteriaceae bacterium]|nr:DUF5018 domain-containing protein [Flavobacteriaceae bacterium]